MPRFLIILIILVFPWTVFAQTKVSSIQECGEDQYRQMLMQQHPEAADALQKMETQLYETRFNHPELGAKGTDGPLVLPVVFHIIHNNGAENIPDSRILAALEYLNLAFSHTGFYAQNGPGSDAGIQFCLAQRAPDGSATTGITRTISPWTELLVNPYDDSLKNLIRWDPLHYINIWVVSSILSNAPPDAKALAGYATLPFAVGSNRDGIVVISSSLGISFPNPNYVLPHEMGHYLGLYHTFGNGCPNDDCLLQGDRVCDTPPDQLTFSACNANSCHTDANAPSPNPFTTDVPDMTDNFLDYTTCANRLTVGQAERMLMLTNKFRFRLLESQACILPCASGTQAILSPSGTIEMKVGDTLKIQNLSQFALHYTWYVDGIAVSNDTPFTFVANIVGIQRIKLVATGETPNCISIAELFVSVACDLQGYIETSADFGTPGNPVQFKAQVPLSTQYQWLVDNNPVGTDAVLSYTFAQTGNYTIKLVANNAYCSFTTDRSFAVPTYCTPSAPPQLSYRGFTCSPEINSMGIYPNGDQLFGGEDCSRILLFKLHPDGRKAWAKRIKLDSINATDNYITKLRILPDYTAIAIGFSLGRRFMLKIDSAGNVLWHKRTTNSTYFNDIVISADGSFLFPLLDSNLHRILQRYDVNGQLLWERRDTLSPKNILLSIESRIGGGFYLLYSLGDAYHPAFVVRMDDNGQVLWSKRIGAPTGLPYLGEIKLLVEPDGGFTCMMYDDGRRTILMRGDDAGTIQWTNTYSASSGVFGGYNILLFTKKTTDNGYLLSGYAGNFINNNGVDHQYYCKIDSSGAVKWSFYIDAFDAAGSLTYGGVSNTGDSWAQQAILPMNNKLDDYLYLAKANAGGFIGNCISKPITVSKGTVSLVSEPFSAGYLQASAPTVEFSPNDTLIVSDIPIYSLIECAEFPVCTENCLNGVDDDGDGFTDCYDSQCSCYETPTCSATTPTSIAAYVAWESAGDDINVLSMPIVANLDPKENKVPEIILQSMPIGATSVNNQLVVFSGDGSNKTQPDKSGVFSNSKSAITVPAVADFNRDGVPELTIRPTNGGNYILNRFKRNTTYPLFTSSFINRVYVNNVSPRNSIADFNKDGIPEIYAGNSIISTFSITNADVVSQQRAIKGDTTLAQGRLAFSNFKYPSCNSVAAELLTRNQCSGSRECDNLELAAGPVIYSLDLSAWDEDAKGLTVRKDLNVLDNGPSIFSDGYTAIGDLNLDNVKDIVVAGKRDNVYGIYVWNVNGLLKWFPYPENTPFSGGLPCIANVFDERTIGYQYDFPEIIAASAHRLTCFNLNIANTNPSAPYWWSIPTTDSLGFTAATAFDFTADGIDEIVYQDATQLRILYGGAQPFPAGVDVDRSWFKIVAPTVTADQYPVVADCDGDGEAEVIFTSFGPNGPAFVGDLRGRLRVLKVQPPSTWAGARSVWNQYGYAPAQIDDDLKVPINPQSRLVYGGGQWPLNQYLGQLPTLDKNLKPVITAGDASISLDSITCADQNTRVHVRVCNNGARNLPDSIPIRFYLSNPTFPGASAWGAIQYLKGPIQPGGCVAQTFSAPAAKGVPMFALLNDNGSQMQPIDLISGFTPARAFECDYTDNLLQTTFSWNTPTLNLGPDLSTCAANALVLNAGPGFSQYIWNDGSTDQQYTAIGPGVYWLKALDACDFAQNDTIRISLSQDGILDLGPNYTICPGDTVQLSVAGFQAVAWSPMDMVSCPTCPSISVAPNQSVLLTATGSNADCFATDTVRITVRPAPMVSFTVTPATGTAANGSIMATVSSGNLPFSYLWSTQPPQIGASAQNLKPGIYTVTITDAYGCSGTQSAEVTQSVGTNAVNQAALVLIANPNPTSGNFTLRGEFGEVVAGTVHIIDVLGRPMADFTFQSAQLNALVDSSTWPAGVYFVYVQVGGKVYALRVEKV